MSLQLVANVIVLASIYALVSTGYVLIYRVSRVLNLAHGELMMIGAYLLVSTASVFNNDPVVALALAAIFGLIMGIVVYAVLMRWLTGEAVLAAVLITIALGILLRGLSILIWTSQQFYPAAMFGWKASWARVPALRSSWCCRYCRVPVRFPVSKASARWCARGTARSSVRCPMRCPRWVSA